MNIEDKLNELDKRIEKLEVIEKRRKRNMIISLIFRIIFYVAIVLIAFYAYSYIDRTIIKPYKNAVNEFNDTKNKTESKIEEYKDKYIKTKK